MKMSIFEKKNIFFFVFGRVPYYRESFREPTGSVGCSTQGNFLPKVFSKNVKQFW